MLDAQKNRLIETVIHSKCLFFLVPTTYVLVEKIRKSIFNIRGLICRPDRVCYIKNVRVIRALAGQHSVTAGQISYDLFVCIDGLKKFF